MESNQSSTFQAAGGQVLLGKRTNCLLVKDDVGKSKPSTRKLPQDGFAFGAPKAQNIESAGEGNWNSSYISWSCLSNWFYLLLTVSVTVIIGHHSEHIYNLTVCSHNELEISQHQSA